MIIELPESDGLELDYHEYKLNEILDTQNTYIESTLLPPSTSTSSSPEGEKLYIDEKDNFIGQQLKSDFKGLSAQILKYCSYCLEQPKLFYTIVLKVKSAQSRSLLFWKNKFVIRNSSFHGSLANF